uniref:Uncharacterized protein n=1 Tax=Brassica campestris TaxID=3711 RepID=M4FIL3_BRACM
MVRPRHGRSVKGLGLRIRIENRQEQEQLEAVEDRLGAVISERLQGRDRHLFGPMAVTDSLSQDQTWTVVKEKHREDSGHGKMCGEWVIVDRCEVFIAYCATCELML